MLILSRSIEAERMVIPLSSTLFYLAYRSLGHQIFLTPPRTEESFPPLERQEIPLRHAHEGVYRGDIAIVADKVDSTTGLKELAEGIYRVM